jgi:IS5 family transposase
MESIPSRAQVNRFVGLELGEVTIPDETSILNFRHLLKQHNLTGAVFEAVKV